MAVEKGIAKGTVISSGDIQRIVKLPPTDGKGILAEKLGISPFLDADDQQKAPFVTYIYEHMIFATERGFPWDHISLVVRFAHQFLKGILVERHQLPDALRDLINKSSILTPLCERHKKQYVDFIYETVLCHYNLYKYVFSRLRDSIKPKVVLDVSVPTVPPPLTQGLSVNVWEYEQSIKEVDKKGLDAQNKLQEVKKKMSEEKIPHKTFDDLNNVPPPYSKMSLEELVKDVLKGCTERKEREFQIQATDMAEDLANKLEKTCVPRPASLGSPPRFKPKITAAGKNEKIPAAQQKKRGSASSVKSKR